MGGIVGKPKDIWIVIYEKGIADAQKVQKSALKLVRRTHTHTHNHTQAHERQNEEHASSTATHSHIITICMLLRAHVCAPPITCLDCRR